MSKWWTPYEDAGVISSGDALLASRIGSIGGDADPFVRLATALCLAELRRGAVCLRLGEPPTLPDDAGAAWPDAAAWRQALARSPLVRPGSDGAADRPLRLVEDRLYLQRYWQDEEVIRTAVDADAAPRAYPSAEVDAAVAAMFADEALSDGTVRRAEPEQRSAAVIAARRRVSLLAGGPGTGKTWTVARILAVLGQLSGGEPSIAVAAPTGKAATRLQQAIAREAPTGAPPGLQELKPSTIHRLLKRRSGPRETFRYHRDNPLPFDVVVIDEMSMVSLPLMARLVEAVGPATRLVLVGDPHQLASVEAGAVFGDLVRRAAPGDGLTTLTANHRFTGTLAAFAEAVLAGDADRAVALLDPARARNLLGTGAFVDNVEFVESADGAAAMPAIRAEVLAQARAVVAAADAGAPAAALREMDAVRVLCAHRSGREGVQRWSRLIEEWTEQVVHRDAGEDWYVGRPVMVTRNDYETGVFNGETGVAVSVNGGVRVAIDQGVDMPLLAPTELNDIETLHAMTIHKSQGSQYGKVTVVLPGPESPLLTRELLYTAVTRAQQGVRIVGTTDAVRVAVSRRVRRASGLGVDTVPSLADTDG